MYPALAIQLLGLSEEALMRGEEAGPAALRDGQLLGRLFESLVVQSVRVYAQVSEAQVRYLRTRNGDREVDIIVERHDGPAGLSPAGRHSGDPGGFTGTVIPIPAM